MLKTRGEETGGGTVATMPGFFGDRSDCPSLMIADLVDRSLCGDQTAFEELIKRYKRVVWHNVWKFLGNSPDAEDAVQEVLLRIYVSLRGYNRRYPFECWVRKITSNYCIDLLRRKKRRPYRFWSELPELQQIRLMKSASGHIDPESCLCWESDAVERLAGVLIASLRPGLKRAFILHKLENWDYPAISKALGISEASVRVRVHRAGTEIQRRFRNHLSTQKRRPYLAV